MIKMTLLKTFLQKKIFLVLAIYFLCFSSIVFADLNGDISKICGYDGGYFSFHIEYYGTNPHVPLKHFCSSTAGVDLGYSDLYEKWLDVQEIFVDMCNDYPNAVQRASLRVGGNLGIDLAERRCSNSR